MSAQSGQHAHPLGGIRGNLNRRSSLAAFFGNSALMASTRNGGVADAHDGALPVNASASLTFGSSEAQ